MNRERIITFIKYGLYALVFINISIVLLRVSNLNAGVDAQRKDTTSGRILLLEPSADYLCRVLLPPSISSDQINEIIKSAERSNNDLEGLAIYFLDTMLFPKSAIEDEINFPSNSISEQDSTLFSESLVFVNNHGYISLVSQFLGDVDMLIAAWEILRDSTAIEFLSSQTWPTAIQFTSSENLDSELNQYLCIGKICYKCSINEWIDIVVDECSKSQNKIMFVYVPNEYSPLELDNLSVILGDGIYPVPIDKMMLRKLSFLQRFGFLPNPTISMTIQFDGTLAAVNEMNVHSQNVH